MSFFTICKSFSQHPEYIALICVELADYILGFASAIKNHRLSSAINQQGIIQKVCVLAIPLVLYPVFKIYGYDDLFNLFIWAFIIPNALSIAENLNALGIIVPDEVMKFFKNNNPKK